MSNAEENFIKQINGKEEQAFHDLFTRFRNYLVLFAMRRVGVLDVAEDIVQETFIAVWEGEKVYSSYAGFKAYLYDVVSNKCMNYLKHKVVESKYISYVERDDQACVGDYDLMQEEVYRELYNAVRELPEKCREVFTLHLEGKKNEEIAELLNINVLTVKSHKQNALHYLKKRLGNLFFLYIFMREV